MSENPEGLTLSPHVDIITVGYKTEKNVNDDVTTVIPADDRFLITIQITNFDCLSQQFRTDGRYRWMFRRSERCQHVIHIVWARDRYDGHFGISKSTMARLINVFNTIYAICPNDKRCIQGLYHILWYIMSCLAVCLSSTLEYQCIAHEWAQWYIMFAGKVVMPDELVLDGYNFITVMQPVISVAVNHCHGNTGIGVKIAKTIIRRGSDFPMLWRQPQIWWTMLWSDNAHFCTNKNKAKTNWLGLRYCGVLRQQN